MLTFLLGLWIGGNHGERKLERIRQGGCVHQFVYHSLHYAGEHWNRVCRICGRHETRWDDTPEVNTPPPGAKLAKGERPRDDAD